jgi:cytochrome o ubiquinol oxidase subunit 2
MKPYLIALGSFVGFSFIVTLVLLTNGAAFPILSPAGSVGTAERDLILRALFLMLIVVVPVVVLAIFIGWHYREDNKKAKYTPNWEHSRMEELIWWSIPFEIVLVLAALTWTSTHELDPMRALPSSAPPINIEVVALPWKWLFIYPDEGVASMNEVVFPVNRDIEFHITADAPMNSFWIPALGGQMYAMTGMTTILHLMANKPGTYVGQSANYSGEGFAQMQFHARAMGETEYANWVAEVKASPESLNQETYTALANPSDTGPVRHFGIVSMSLTDIVKSYLSNHVPKTTTPSLPEGMMNEHN